MPEPVVIPPGGGEVVGESPARRVEILSERDSLHVTWSRYGPRREGADLHVHRHHTDLFYVLAGELTIRLGVEDEQHALPAGTLAVVPPMVAHGFRNGGDAEVRYLNFHAPGVGFADYMRGLGSGGSSGFDQEPPPAEVRPASEAVIADGVLLADVEAIRVAEVRVEPGAEPPAPQAGGERGESLYVLDGEEAGTWLEVPAGSRHPLSFPRSEPVRYLSVRAPNPAR